MRPEQIPYGVKDFKRIRLENRYRVDKTNLIRNLEERADFLFFVRPRRFGKTLLCETLRCYYDVVTMGRVRRGHLSFRIPNECVRRQIFEYMRSEYAKRPNAIDVDEFKGRELVRLEEVEDLKQKRGVCNE